MSQGQKQRSRGLRIQGVLNEVGTEDTRITLDCTELVYRTRAYSD